MRDTRIGEGYLAAGRIILSGMTLNPLQVMLSPVNRENFRIAWRVLTQFNAGEEPAVEDIRLLKLNAPPAQRRLRIDDLACMVMRRELSSEVA